ncbi:MAG: hypothetical protein U5K74_16505 [Gemmatimonadaceae bacterium]|nr:hypothetical protein [Gemmatimonadaceae bacterium]
MPARAIELLPRCAASRVRWVAFGLALLIDTSWRGARFHQVEQVGARPADRARRREFEPVAQNLRCAQRAFGVADESCTSARTRSVAIGALERSARGALGGPRGEARRRQGLAEHGDGFDVGAITSGTRSSG